MDMREEFWKLAVSLGMLEAMNMLEDYLKVAQEGIHHNAISCDDCVTGGTAD